MHYKFLYCFYNMVIAIVMQVTGCGGVSWGRKGSTTAHIVVVQYIAVLDVVFTAVLLAR